MYKSRLFIVGITFGDQVEILNMKAQVWTEIAKALSYFGGIFALWKVMNVFLYQKYRNRQARMVEEFEFKHKINENKKTNGSSLELKTSV